MKSEAKEVLVLRKLLKNHYSFYDSLVFNCEEIGSKYIQIIQMDIAADDFSKDRINAYLIARRIFSSDVSHYILEEGEGMRRILYVAVISRFFKRIKFTICIHNLNSWLSLLHPFSIRKLISFLMKSYVVNRSTNIVVVSSDVADYASQILGADKIKMVPFRLPNIPESEDDGESIIVCIPGNVEEQRRDYWTVFEAFEVAKRKGSKAKLILLGVYNELNVSENFRLRIEKMSLEFKDDLILFSEFVSDDVFDAYVKKSTALVCNIVKYYWSGNNLEIYGLSKETGIKVLAEAYGKKCFIPSYMPCSSNNKDNYIVYDSPIDLAKKFLELNISINKI